MAAAREVMELSRVRDNANQITDTVMRQAMDGIMKEVGAKGNAADSRKLGRVTSILSGELSAVMRETMPAYLDAVTEVYARTYSLSELRAIAVFYRSPAGQSMIQKQGLLAKGVVTAMQTTLLPKVVERMPTIMERAKVEAAKPE